MLLDNRQQLRANGLHHFVVALLGISRQILGLSWALTLLGLSLVEILRVRSDQILDHKLMLGVEMFRQIDLDVCLLRYPFQLFGGLRVRQCSGSPLRLAS